MTSADKLLVAFNTSVERFPEIQKRTADICSRIRGWSNTDHYLFFKAAIDMFTEERPMRILIVGVYLGRDIAFMLDAAGDKPVHVTGVDKFNAEPCDDWPKEKLHMTWEEAFNCPPPDRDEAIKNIAPYNRPHHILILNRADDKDWLEQANGAYDLIFLDASHEFESINRQIWAVHKLCHPLTIVSGDDYAPVQPGWGVSDAVKQSFKFHHHIDNRIWFAGAEDYL